MKCPSLGESFTLKLNGQSNPPEKMLENVPDARNWGYQGVTITGLFENQFKLVKIGYQPNLEHAQRALGENGYTIPGDQWLLAFREKYPQGNKNPIGIASDSWLDPLRNSRFIFIDISGNLDFQYKGSPLIEGWRWLVLA